MSLLKRFFTHSAHPEGRMGRMMLRFMNFGHAPLTNWGLSHVTFNEGMTMLDKQVFVCLKRDLVHDVSGGGGNRTLVRTRKPYAFYMLIPAFIFVMQQDPDHQLHPYPLKLHPIIEA